MNYDLAKKLEEAGFPYNWNIDGLNWITPTLSELIKGCGDKFDRLERCEYPEGNVDWRAYPTEEAWEGTKGYKEYPCVMDCCGYESGDTPEQAVAELYLALNEK